MRIILLAIALYFAVKTGAELGLTLLLNLFEKKG